jgi:hypothetical protein
MPLRRRRIAPAVRALLGIAALAAVPPAAAQIVGHAAIDPVATLPQCALDGAGQQRWFFAHASVGGNLIEGLADLHAADPVRFQLATEWVGYDDASQLCTAPAGTSPGTVYECDRGNPGWQAKLTIFDRSVRLAGWRQPAVDLVLDKLCFIDQDADAGTYLASMAALEAGYPYTRFVYATMPLTTGEDADNVLRNQYNQAVRAQAAASGALLFDLADMEAHDPAGVAQSFQSGGHTWQKLYAGYTTDGGHLDTELGHRRVAQGWYAVAATRAACLAFADGFEGGDTSRWSVTLP